MSGTLVIRGLHAVRGDKPVLRGLDLEVEPGEVVALMGVSGAGKSTVLRAVAALEPFTAGLIEVGGFRLAPGPVPRESRLRELRRKVGMVFQSHALFPHLTALENVTLAPVHVLGWPAATARQAAMELLESLGVGPRAGAYPRELSGGEAQRVAIARALAPDPAVLLMDEPTSALDPARRGALGESLRKLARGGRGLLVATHDVDFALAHTDRVLVLHEGRMAEYGTSSMVLTQPSEPATRELLAHERRE
ncbi:amino acid ABC transporter ATP-binding protein [Longimicrobium sp.]|uniref:amino acid ABC transporter ATP-binding protein n=1 Tax=Longimicrobium sp. TaxID=2029185 RepID=UPI002E37AC96|nr:ATP-binding cassette domain-containing protein [Longimicrobium sp.]HEX6038347.1 ATP-binding cassette domain-containing protein [Longimicrobium sp.]